MTLTYQTAREMSILAWKMRIDGEEDDKIASVLTTKYGFLPFSLCGFCEYYNHSCVYDNKCPMKWQWPKTEKHSHYDPRNSLPCARPFWKYQYWKDESEFHFEEEGDGKKAIAERLKKYWAQKMLDILMTTPKEEPK